MQPGDAHSSQSAANRQRTSTARRSKLLLVRQRQRLSGFSYSARRHHLCFSIHSSSSSSSSRAVNSTHRTYRCRSSSVQLIALTCEIAVPLLIAGRRTALIELKVNDACSTSGLHTQTHTDAYVFCNLPLHPVYFTINTTQLYNNKQLNTVFRAVVAELSLERCNQCHYRKFISGMFSLVPLIPFLFCSLVLASLSPVFPLGQMDSEI